MDPSGNKLGLPFLTDLRFCGSRYLHKLCSIGIRVAQIKKMSGTLSWHLGAS